MDTTSGTSPLLTPARLAGIDLPNRLVIAPMTRNRAEPSGAASALMAEYYAQRASAGLVIAEASTPNAVGQTYPNIAALHRPEHVEGWRAVTRRVAEAGGRMFLQIQHGGRVGHPATSGLTPVAPSPVALPDTIHTPGGRQPAVTPREMDRADIDGTVADFAAAARRAVDAGFLGVEVHAANGYLLHQFLAPTTNRRQDAYGGAPRNRMRFVLEVVGAVVDEIGPDRVGVRVSPGNTSNGIAETADDIAALYPGLTERLDALGPAYLHVAFADPDSRVWKEIRSRWSRTLVGNPVLPAEGIPADGGRAAGERMLEAGADLVALGRPFLANPDLVERIRTGAPVNPVRDKYLMYVGGATGYTDYPAAAL
ncbi:alkene reductase [Nocardiopsis tropica]|uniref:Alkene reductase n=1 Tax=Streptomonospora nanhaiensis TaxID=1323731 RepID=A0ABY6YV86_9ACTN|nr:alkene reductase [Streptomonospora nanhaiensis]MEE2043302.1 alkene reductase [Nocardiopsis tropica]WAE76261.1 alkene reductase [Streptomonospora nanhaiensis]